MDRKDTLLWFLHQACSQGIKEGRPRGGAGREGGIFNPWAIKQIPNEIFPVLTLAFALSPYRTESSQQKLSYFTPKAHYSLKCSMNYVKKKMKKSDEVINHHLVIQRVFYQQHLGWHLVYTCLLLHILSPCVFITFSLTVEVWWSGGLQVGGGGLLLHLHIY